MGCGFFACSVVSTKFPAGGGCMWTVCGASVACKPRCKRRDCCSHSYSHPCCQCLV
ncbi:hypothetical protein B0T18DRAFT_403606 [Schizothecium vesticola]|uniref:Uncharacterized protein n=1 Tax=Schizothecium vesticola TaxID=314040 RepID=A0AA40F6C3_9PEZI|nr:hypothetical protein B0T18DRAFT_403606 [Schizothecium vesticola]